MARPNLPQFEPEYDYYKMRTFVDELNRWIDTVESGESGAGGGNGGGTGVHNDLTGRDAADAHPISAISGLTATLSGLASSIASNTANIAFNAAGIAANASSIGVNAAAIAANAALIEATKDRLLDAADNIAMIALGGGNTELRSLTSTDAEDRRLFFSHADATVRASIGNEFGTTFLLRNHITGANIVLRVGVGGGNRDRIICDGDQTIGSVTLFAGTSPAGGTVQANIKGFLVNDGTLFLREVAVKEATDVGVGQVWVRNDVANTLMFTDDADVDWIVGGFLAINDLQDAYDAATTVPQITLNATPDPFTIDAMVAGDIMRVRDTSNVDVLNVATTGIRFSNAYTFPTADGAADQILVTDGAGALTYQAQAISGGLLSAEYRFSTSIVAADPGSGRYRFDTAAYSTVTEIFIDDETDNGVDISNFLALISKGDRLYFQVKSNADRFVVFDVIVDAVDNTGWFTIGVNAIASGVFFSNNDKCLMVWGIDGDTRPQMPWYEGMSTRAMVFSDFMEPVQGLQVDGLQSIAAGAGSGVTAPTGTYDFTNHPGVWGLNTGATAAGRVFLLSIFAKGFQVGVGGITRHGCWYQSPAVASDVTNRYVLRSGFFSMALPNTVLQGIGFEAQDDQNGGRWQAITEDGIGETSVDTGVAVGTSTYFLLELEVNAAGTSVEFFIDQVSVATITTNIPSGLAFEHFISEHIMKLIGTANRAAYVDAYYFYQEVTR